jgi:hypothetical protein
MTTEQFRDYFVVSDRYKYEDLIIEKKIYFRVKKAMML